MESVAERLKASMVLAGVGDAVGYKNGAWEFCRSGKRIHEELEQLGGLEKIKITKNWMVSDDTVMHIATAEALVEDWGEDKVKLYSKLAERYKECMKDMSGRAPGLTCMELTHMLRPAVPRGYIIPYNPRGGGCGAAMRSAPIGLYYHRPDQLEDLVAVSVESGRMTHNHPTGFLGSLATALFVSYALQQKPMEEWGAGLLETVDLAEQYVLDPKQLEGRDPSYAKNVMTDWGYFKGSWQKYLELRGISDGRSDPIFPDQYDVVARDKFYKSLSYSGTGGASGHDAPMIAYDALLSCGGNWQELCLRGMLHGGDSDSTGITAAACWGAMRGFEQVPEGHYKFLEYRDRLVLLAQKIYKQVA